MPSITINWTPVAGATKYTVYRSTDGSRGAAIGSVAAPPYTDASVVPGSSYFYEVTASNAAGESAASAQAGATLPAPVPAPAISNATVTPSALPIGGGSVSINATVANATSVTLDGAPVTLPVVVPVSASHTFSLVAQGATAPDASASLPVTVALPAPTVGPLSTLAANTARNLGDYTNPDPQFTQSSPAMCVNLAARAITDYSNLRYDPVTGKAYIFGGAHGASQETDIRAVDRLTLKWASLYPSTPASAMINSPGNVDHQKGMWINSGQAMARHTYNGSVIRNGKLVLPQYRAQPAFLGDCSVNWNGYWGGRTAQCPLTPPYNWTFGTMGGDPGDGISPPYTPWTELIAATLDPVSNNVAIVGSARDGSGVTFYLWNPDDDTVLTGPLVSASLVSGGALVYHEPSDSFFYLAFPYASGNAVAPNVYKIVVDCTNIANTTVTQLATTGTPPMGTWGGPTGFAHDSVNDRIGGQPTNGTFYELNPTTLAWTSKAMQLEAGSTGTLTLAQYCLDFNTDDGCYLFLNTPPSGSGQTTWAYRP